MKNVDNSLFYYNIPENNITKSLIKSLEKYLKTKEEERDVELNERSW